MRAIFFVLFLFSYLSLFFFSYAFSRPVLTIVLHVNFFSNFSPYLPTSLRPTTTLYFFCNFHDYHNWNQIARVKTNETLYNNWTYNKRICNIIIFLYFFLFLSFSILPYFRFITFRFVFFCFISYFGSLVKKEVVSAYFSSIIYYSKHYFCINFHDVSAYVLFLL